MKQGSESGAGLPARVYAEPAALWLWRLVDWRFLLPPERVTRICYVGDVSSDELQVIAESGACVCTDGSSEEADVVVVTHPTPEALTTAADRVRIDGWVLLRLGDTRQRVRSRLLTSSVRAWNRRLRRSGLSLSTAHWHAPNAERCSYIVSLEDRTAIFLMLKRYDGVRFGLLKSMVARTLHRFHCIQLVARDVTLVAQRQRAPGRSNHAEPSALLPLEVERRIAGDWPPAKLLITPWFEASRHVVCIYANRGKGAGTAVVKLPRRPWDISGIQREASVLDALVNHTNSLLGQVPVVREVALGERPYLVETVLQGHAVAPERVRADVEGVLDAANEFIRRLPVTGSTTEDREWFARLVTDPLQSVARLGCVAGVNVASLVEETLDLLVPIAAETLPLIFEHGDLSHPNLLRMQDGQLGVLDWERADPKGLPLTDLCFLLQYVVECQRRAVEVPAQRLAFDAAFTGPDAWGRRRIARYLESIGLDIALAPPLIVATWARSSVSLLPRLVNPDAKVARGIRNGGNDAILGTFLLDRDFALWRHAVERYHMILR